MEVEEVQQRLGRAIAERRRALSMTQEALAEALESSSEWISQVERGVGQPSLPFLIRLAGALRMPFGQLMAAADPAEDGGGNANTELVAELVLRARVLPEAALRVLVGTAALLEREVMVDAGTDGGDNPGSGSTA